MVAIAPDEFMEIGAILIGVIRIDHLEVTQLDGAVDAAGKRLTLDDETRAEPGAQVDECDAASTLRAAEAGFGERHGAHVVLDGDRNAENRLHQVRDGNVTPVEVDRKQDAPTRRVDGTGHRDSDAEHEATVDARVGNQRLNRLRSLANDVAGRHRQVVGEVCRPTAAPEDVDQAELYETDTDLHPDDVKKIATDLGVPEQEVINMNRRMIMGGDGSLNTPMRNGEEGSGEWQDWLSDDGPLQDELVADAQESEVRHDMLVEAMDSLNDREKHILTERRLTENPQTLEELSQVYDVSRERIRQIEVRAFEKLQKAMKTIAGEKLLPGVA